MMRRKSIDIEGFRHANPIPNASRVGNLLMTGLVVGRDSAADAMPDTLEDQCALMFRHVRSIVEAAGGTTDDIVKMNVWLRDPGNREALNAEWTRMFPDPESRPARHTNPEVHERPWLVSCDFVAVLP